MWSELYHDIHIPNQRADEIERIKNLKLKRETIAEEVSINNSVKLKRSNTERRCAMLLSSDVKKQNFASNIRSRKSKNRKFVQTIMKGTH